MALRVPWDKYEAALLLNYCIRIEKGEISKAEAISTVSQMLRNRAIRKGYEIDDVFRNENGISMQISSMNAIVDQFGKQVPTEEIDDNHFKVTVTVSPSPTFYRWVFGWNGAMKILGPETVKNEYKQMIMNSLDVMD